MALDAHSEVRVPLSQARYQANRCEALWVERRLAVAKERAQRHDQAAAFERRLGLGQRDRLTEHLGERAVRRGQVIVLSPAGFGEREQGPCLGARALG